MKLLQPQFILALACAGLAAAACVHTPPGTSVNIALAKRPQLVRLPSTPMVAAKKSSLSPLGPSVQVQDKTELVADAFSRGEFCMKAGKNDEAISAFREAVKVDPNFTQAWNNLAILYENTGQDKLAMDSFKKAKKIASQ